MTNPLLRTSLLPAYGPASSGHAKGCPRFRNICSQMRWCPSSGHVPRGFWGALGDVRDVELVLVAAEPGDPLPDESHKGIQSPLELFESVSEYSLQCLRSPATPFHRNIRLILDLCFPHQPLDQQLRRTWRTNAVLCSAEVECGPVPRQIEETCVTTYLRRQLALLPHAFVAALGDKAQRRLERQGISFFPALHPANRKSNEEKVRSWTALAEALRRYRLNR